MVKRRIYSPSELQEKIESGDPIGFNEKVDALRFTVQEAQRRVLESLSIQSISGAGSETLIQAMVVAIVCDERMLARFLLKLYEDNEP